MNTRQNEFVKAINDLNHYISNLYKNDVSKFNQRVLSFVHLHEIILDIVDPDVAEDKRKTMQQLAFYCAKEAAKYRGKGGPQQYSTLLSKLKQLCDVDVSNKKDKKDVEKVTADFIAAYDKVESESGDILINAYGEMLEKVKGYLKTLGEEIEKSKEDRFFKIDVALSHEKKKIAKDLKESLKNFKTEPGRDTYLSLLEVIVKADDDHKKALKGKIGKAQRLNKLITQLKNIAKENSPTDYFAIANDYAEKELNTNSSPSLNQNEKD